MKIFDAWIFLVVLHSWRLGFITLNNEHLLTQSFHKLVFLLSLTNYFAMCHQLGLTNSLWVVHSFQFPFFTFYDLNPKINNSSSHHEPSHDSLSASGKSFNGDHTTRWIQLHTPHIDRAEYDSGCSDSLQHKCRFDSARHNL